MAYPVGMGMLELGKTRRQKWRIVWSLLALHFVAIATVVGVFLVVKRPQLPEIAEGLVIVATITWLMTFILLCVNIAYLVLKRD